MATDMLQRILRRFKKEDFESVLAKWDDTGQDILKKVDISDTKQSTISNIVKLCLKRKISSRDVGLLDMKYMQTHSSRMQWSVYQLEKLAGEEYNLVDTKEFEDLLGEQLKLFFNFDMCVDNHSGAIWTRLYIDENRFLQSNVIFIVYYPHTPVVLMTRIKASHKDYVLQALMNIMEAAEIKECRLTGHHLESLAQLALNRCSQGGFSKYRLNENIPNPLGLRKGQKRKRKDSDSLDIRIVCEYKEEHEVREEKLDDTFGSTLQPTLEKLVYKLETSFKGYDEIPGMERSAEPFHCRVKFEGTNVLEGIRNLAKCGLATLPLPRHLGDVPSLARNYFVIGDKKKRTVSSEESHLDQIPG